MLLESSIDPQKKKVGIRGSKNEKRVKSFTPYMAFSQGGPFSQYSSIFLHTNKGSTCAHTVECSSDGSDAVNRTAVGAAILILSEILKLSR